MTRKIISLVLLSTFGGAVFCYAQKLAIVRGTLIDLSNYGRSTNDVANSVVLIDEGKIIAVGPASEIQIPPNATSIDAHGKFLIPGLIDGFGALRNQSFANAYLYEGVTTVYVATVLPDGGGDGEDLRILKNASPGAPAVSWCADDRLFREWCGPVRQAYDRSSIARSAVVQRTAHRAN